MNSEYEYVVVGLGGIGSGAAYWLARRAGGSVLGLEQFEMGHHRGASEDHSRIIRRSYHTPGYVRLAGEAYEAWRALEVEAGERLILRTGGLDLWPPDAAIPKSDYTKSMRACGVPFEELDASEIMRRWPPFRLDEGVEGVFQADAGIAAATRCNAAHRRLALEHGAVLRSRSPVVSVHSVAGEVEVATEDVAYRCRRAIIACDAWTNRLLEPLGRTLPLTITQEQVTYFAARDAEAFMPDRFPIWIWMDDPSFYGFPCFGEAGPKAAQDVGGRETTPASRTFETDARASRRLSRFLDRHLPGALGPVITTKTCLYTLTPDRDFVLDAVPGHPGVLVALGAAHGFKFASLFGRILSELALDGVTDTDLEPYRMDRPVLTMKDPPKHFLT